MNIPFIFLEPVFFYMSANCRTFWLLTASDRKGGLGINFLVGTKNRTRFFQSIFKQHITKGCTGCRLQHTAFMSWPYSLFYFREVKVSHIKWTAKFLLLLNNVYYLQKEKNLTHVFALNPFYKFCLFIIIISIHSECL